MKRCKDCGEVRPLKDFYRDRAARDGHRPRCRSCERRIRAAWYRTHREEEIARVKAWQVANRDRHLQNQRKRRQRPEVKARERAGHLRRKYGISPEEYQRLFEAQKGRCGISRREPNPKISLHVDHDHVTGAVRGLLCVRCNNGIALFDESHEVLRDIAAYLDAHDPEVQEMAALIRERARSLITSAR